MSKGTLYLCATPIGNLEDITLRAINVLKSVDAVLCEDTRRTIKLLNHFDIKKPLISYHEHNAKQRNREILDKLHDGMSLALVSDAGMPCISDPGASIVSQAISEGIAVTVIPGACAAVAALAVSGLDAERFVFEGFLPEKQKLLNMRLQEIKKHKMTTVIYASPHDLVKNLKSLNEALGDRKIAVVRELTKLHEEIIRCSLSEAIMHFKSVPPRGEFVLVIEGLREKKIEPDTARILSEINRAVESGMSNKDAIKTVSAEYGLKKTDVYKIFTTQE